VLKIHIRSDDHHEFYRGSPGWHPVPENAEIIILAGDIDIGCEGIKWASTLGKPVLYVAGNHELYKGNIDAMEYEMRRVAKEAGNVYFLQNDTHIIGSIRFLGTTLWSDYNLLGNPAVAKSYAEFSLSDHKLISKGYAGLRRLLSPDDALKIHNRSKGWLISELVKPWAGKTVVITHHAPHPRSVHSKFTYDRLSPAFASDLTDIICSFDIDLWVHGHMHNASDYTVHGTRIVCNPHGYPGTTEPVDFNPNFTIEL
jgi:Icc-related predicted phosphoesterase